MSGSRVPIIVDVFLDQRALGDGLRAEVARGLKSTPKQLSPTWLYDDAGCELYDQITRLAEYYPFRAERDILASRAKDIVAATQPDTLVELGSGTSEKTRFLLDAMTMPARYVPFDVSESTLREAAGELVEEYPDLAVHGVVGDFAHDLDKLPSQGRRLIALLGGTVGNLDPTARAALLKTVAAGMNQGDAFVLGTDLVKDRARLIAAYDDAAGVTAAFNRNVLVRLNRELGANFEVECFRHVAIFDEVNQWIEMRLVASGPQNVRVDALALDVEFVDGEAVRTEISAKFTAAAVARELLDAGMAVVEQWTDNAGDFLLTLAALSP